MASGSRVCTHCGALNGIDEKTCYRCGKRMAGPLGASARSNCCGPSSLRGLGLAFDVDWQRELEGRALGDLGFDPQPAAVHLEDLLGDGEAQAGAALCLGGGNAVAMAVER